MISTDLKDLPGEKWKDVVGYEGLYLVSNKGRIKSLPHRVKRGFCECMTNEIILIPKTNGLYDKVCLFSGSKKTCKQQYVHRLVATAFILNPNKYPQIDHIDGNHTNNVVENLRWCNQMQNVNNPITKNRSKRLRKIFSLSLDGNIIKEYDSLTSASKDTGVPISSICCIAGGRAKMTGRKYRLSFRYKN